MSKLAWRHLWATPKPDVEKEERLSVKQSTYNQLRMMKIVTWLATNENLPNMTDY